MFLFEQGEGIVYVSKPNRRANVVVKDPFLFKMAVTKSGTGTWDLGREDLGTGDAGTRGRGDAGTRGRGDAGTRGRGTRGRGDVGTWGRGTRGRGTRGR